MVRAALAFLDFLTDWNRDRTAAGLPLFVARIGIHTGPVVAGVVGSDKFAYDIWGETVNIAARMETASEPGRVNISAATQALVAAHFRCTCRGLIPARNIGEVEAYFVEEPV
jgi:class 3 adenylate cyclase